MQKHLEVIVMGTLSLKNISRVVSATGLLCCGVLAVWGWQSGVLTSQQAMEELVSKAGPLGAALFILLQIVQVVVPIIPGGLSCLAGVLLFGPWLGFFCNYVGICIGSMLAFAVAKNYGRPLLPKMFSASTIRKYESWTCEGSPFAKWFALAIFFPVAPDDFLCYLAGTTAMRWWQFNAIIWLCKPFSIALYSLGLQFIWTHISALFT